VLYYILITYFVSEDYSAMKQTANYTSECSC